MLDRGESRSTSHEYYGLGDLRFTGMLANKTVRADMFSTNVNSITQC